MFLPLASSLAQNALILSKCSNSLEQLQELVQPGPNTGLHHSPTPMGSRKGRNRQRQREKQRDTQIHIHIQAERDRDTETEAETEKDHRRRGGSPGAL